MTVHEPTLEELIAFEQELNRDQEVNRNDITKSFSITHSGLQHVPGTRQFVQRVTLTNVTMGPISGPMSLVLDSLTNNVTLVNKAAVTANFPPLDSPFVTVGLGDDNLLDPPESVAVFLKFVKATDAEITYDTRVLQGVLPP